MVSPGWKKSPAWDYFLIIADTNFVVCQSCNEKVSCGSKNSKRYVCEYRFGAAFEGQHAQPHKEFQQKIELQNAATTSSSPASSNRYHFEKVEIVNKSGILMMQHTVY